MSGGWRRSGRAVERPLLNSVHPELRPLTPSPQSPLSNSHLYLQCYLLALLSPRVCVVYTCDYVYMCGCQDFLSPCPPSLLRPGSPNRTHAACSGDAASHLGPQMKQGISQTRMPAEQVLPPQPSSRPYNPLFTKEWTGCVFVCTVWIL